MGGFFSSAALGGVRTTVRAERPTLQTFTLAGWKRPDKLWPLPHRNLTAITLEQHEAFSNLVLGQGGVRSEDIVINTSAPQPQGEGPLHEHGPAGVVLGQQLPLTGALDA